MSGTRLSGILASGLLASTVLLALSSTPPALSVSDLWALGESTDVTVHGVLVSLRSYESGSEVLVLADETGHPTVKIVCQPGPTPPPSARASMGDLLGATGECVFEDAVPTMYCGSAGVRVIRPSEEVVTVGLVCSSWRLFEGDTFRMSGVCSSAGGLPRLHDARGDPSLQMRLDRGVEAVEGPVVVEATLVMDTSVLALVLEVHGLEPLP